MAAGLLDQFDDHVAVALATKQTLAGPVAALARQAAERIEAGGKVVFFGNGGSAADAQHLAAELTIRFRTNRRALPAIALTTDSSALTACGNDFGFDEVFARQVEALVRSDDMVFGISTSGTSPNVLRGLTAARAAGALTVGLTGKKGDRLGAHCDVVLAVPSIVTARIQEMHILLGHLFCSALEDELGLGGDTAR
jgi:D-sedoheptulose 7-phosphate isomerase